MEKVLDRIGGLPEKRITNGDKTMFSIERTLGILFSGGTVRLASIGIALYVGLTLGGEVLDMLGSVTDAFAALPR